jgi:RimJ/RimL family protein N-acetyltransferase
MDVVPFEPEHMETLILQPAQQRFFTYFNKEYAKDLKVSGPCFTGIKNGRVLGCAGLVKQWENRAIAWSLLSGDIGNDFISIHKAVMRFLKLSEYNRIEAFVDANFEQGHRWIEMLGFKREGYMEQFNPDGGDAMLYARLKNG